MISYKFDTNFKITFYDEEGNVIGNKNVDYDQFDGEIAEETMNLLEANAYKIIGEKEYEVEKGKPIKDTRDITGIVERDTVDETVRIEFHTASVIEKRYAEADIKGKQMMHDFLLQTLLTPEQVEQFIKTGKLDWESYNIHPTFGGKS